MKEKLDINLSKPKKYKFNVLDFLILLLAVSVIFVLIWQHGVFKSRTIDATAKMTLKIENVTSFESGRSLEQGMTVYNKADDSLLGRINNIEFSQSGEYYIDKNGEMQIFLRPDIKDVTFEMKDISGRCNLSNDFFMLNDGSYITVGDTVEIITESGVYTATVISFTITAKGDIKVE